MKANIALVIVDTFTAFDAEYAGPSRIAAYLRQHSISASMVYIDVSGNTSPEELIDKIPRESNLIGFSIYNTNAKIVYSLCKQIKERNPKAFTYVGSRLATTAPELILKDCTALDFVMLGDGEITTYEVVQKYESDDFRFGSSPHIFTRDSQTNKYPAIVDIMKMPWISRDFFRTNKKQNFFSARMTGSRGCTAHCSFCSMAESNKAAHDTWKGRTIEDIFNEIITIHQEYGIRSFSFTDNSFEDPGTLGKERILDFCKRSISYGEKLHFWCYLRAETFCETDTELIELMRQAGFTQVFIGIEACNAADLGIYNKRAGVEDNYRAYRLFSSKGIDVVPGYIMINPYSTIDCIQKNYNFLKENKLAIFKLYYRHLEIYYGTDIHLKLEKEGMLRDDYTYLNTLAYHFADNRVGKISKFLLKTVVGSEIEKLDGEFQTFLSSVAFFRAVLPEVMEKYKNELQKIREQLADQMVGFFSILYIEQNIEKAEAEFLHMENRIKAVYHQFRILKLKILKERDLLMLLVNMKRREQNQSKTDVYDGL